MIVLTFVYTIVLLPFAYLKALIIKYKVVYDQKNSKKILGQNLIYAIFFTLMGMPMIFLSLFSDILYFFKF